MRFLLLALIIICNIQGAAALTPDEASALNQRGRDFLAAEPEQTDSAIACFRRVADAYSPDLPPEMRATCTKAMINLSTVYFSSIDDYKTSYEYLIRARDSSQTIDDPRTLAGLDLMLGNIYATFAEHVDSPEFTRESVRLYHDALHKASAAGLWDIAVYSFSNLTSMFQAEGFADIAEDDVRLFAGLQIPAVVNSLAYARLRQRSMEALLDNDLATATSFSRAQHEAADPDLVTSDIALRYQALRITSELYLLRNLPDSAMHYAEILAKEASASHDHEAKANAYRLMMQVNRSTGNEEAYKEAYASFLIEQYSLLNVNNLSQVNNLKFINELASQHREAGEKIASASRHRTSAIIAAALIALIAIAAIYILVRRHRKLRLRYMDLYRQYQQTLLDDSEDRLQRIEDMKQETDALSAQPSGLQPDEDTGEAAQKTRILAALDGTDEIFSPDFSLERLAEMTGIRPRTLSAVLNDTMKTTFRDLLNRYRVREACRRLQDNGRYGNLTIAAISESVGYRSRTTLISAFKKETGMSPSDYLKMARLSN